MGIMTRLRSGWNAFLNRDPTQQFINIGYGSSNKPYRINLSRGHERSIATAIFNKIAMDCSSIDIRHVKTDENKRFIEYVNSGLDNCLTLEANVDQTGKAFIQDIVLSMLDEGVVAIVPVDTDIDPTNNNSVTIETMRTGKIKEWFPRHVLVEVYNDRTGIYEDLTLPKTSIAIVENPLYAVINEHNSTLQRLVRKLVLLDNLDNQSASGKLDMIIQLPYLIKTEQKRIQAERRKKDIEEQLSGSKYGIAYIDGTEKVTQLNRSVENNLLPQIEYLTKQLYSQLGITEGILDGSADEKTMLNYYSRTIEPILSAICDSMKRSFLTKTARTQGQSIEFFRDLFTLLPVSNLAEIADKFTRNEILTSNEFRQIIGLKPAEDPNADALMNKNIAHDTGITNQENYDQNQEFNMADEQDKIMNEVLDQLSQEIDSIIQNVEGDESDGTE